MANTTDRKAELLAAWRQRWRAADFTWAGLKKHELQGWVVAIADAREVLREAESGRVYGAPLPLEGGGAGGGGEDVSAAPNDRSDIVQTDAHPTPLPPPPLGEGARQATLQDYWRADPATGLLRDPKEMLRAGEIVYSAGLGRNDHLQHVRALQDDAVVSALARAELYHITHLPLEWDDGTSTVKADWPDDALDAIIVARLAVASETQWGGDSYNRKIIGADRDAQLQGTALAIASGHEGTSLSLRLDQAQLLRDCDFTNAVIAGDARFRSAAFLGSVSFGGVVCQGQLRFERATFYGDATFRSAKYLEAWFLAAEFLSDAGFEAVRSGTSRFVRAQFRGYTRFDGAEFSSVSFNDASFEDDVWFDNIDVRAAARFHRATFKGLTRFVGARFARTADFARASFAVGATFDEAHFHGDMDFKGATFKGQTSFKGVSWVNGADEHGRKWAQSETDWRRTFYGTEFNALVDFERAGARAFSAFDGAHFERGITFDRPKESELDRTFRRELKLADEAGLVALESGCRVLKQAMAYHSDKAREQIYYRYELIAKRKQKATRLTEKAFSWTYGATARYGDSIGLPFAWLTGLVFAFAGIYWLADAGFANAGATLAAIPNGAIEPNFRDALTFSFSRVFPFGAFEDVSKHWIEAFEAEDTVATLLIRIAASVQSAFALALVFVFGLSVRRKFQIS